MASFGDTLSRDLANVIMSRPGAVPVPVMRGTKQAVGTNASTGPRVPKSTDDDAVAIIRNVTPPDEDAMRLAARAAIELLRARGVNGIPLQTDNARIDRFVAEFNVPPPQI